MINPAIAIRRLLSIALATSSLAAAPSAYAWDGAVTFKIAQIETTDGTNFAFRVQGPSPMCGPETPVWVYMNTDWDNYQATAALLTSAWMSGRQITVYSTKDTLVTAVSAMSFSDSISEPGARAFSLASPVVNKGRHRGYIMRTALAFAVGLFGCGTAHAQETTTYQYDALGRLVTSTVSGGPNSNTQTSITYDPAGNRTNYTVAGSPNQGNGDPNAGSGTPSTQMTVIVVPLNGFTVIPIMQ